MGLNQLQQILRILCYNTEWNYAVFWKLNCKPKMLLTWEDAFFANHEPLDPARNLSVDSTSENEDKNYLQNPLGLAMAKMSPLVYSLGEGIIGQVALTGDHQWILTDKPTPTTWLPLECSDGWHAQFSAGIRTAVVVSVFPLGVVQLGSLNNVIEDVNLVILVKNLLYSLQNLMGCFPSQGECFAGSNLFLGKKDGVMAECIGESLMPSKDESAESRQPQSVCIGLEHLKPAKMNLYRQKELIDGIKNNELQKDSKRKPDMHTNSSYTGGSSISFNFPDGSELHEALGLSYMKDNDSRPWNEPKRTENGTIPGSQKEVVDSWLEADPESSDLLEAIVGNAGPKSNDVNGDESFCKLDHSVVTVENPIKIHCYFRKFSSSAGEPVIPFSRLEDDTNDCLNSISSKACESSLKSTRTEQLEMQVQPDKINKKRARSDSYRPRPRDRQLIQDRVKELRHLVPNGSKCSIDTLLARTIKHMLYLESVTEHAEKLKRCDGTKLHANGMGILGSFDCPHGASWALQAESQEEVCPITLKSFDASGKMLVEMLCEDCSHFLDVARAIRDLGLTILKAAIEDHGKKTRGRFLVEGGNGRCFHRMDVMLSLVQLLKPKSAI